MTFDFSLTIIPVVFLCTLAMLYILIKIQNNYDLFQFIRPEGPQSHLEKKKTVTAGGTAVIIGQVVFLLSVSQHSFVVVYCQSLVLFGLLGLVDDILKISRQGLSSKMKFLGQCVISIYLLSSFVYSHYPMNMIFTHTIIPLWGKVALPPIALMSLNFLAHISTSNAANLTDGQDGLLAQIFISLWTTITIFLLISFAYQTQRLGSYPLEVFAFIGLANMITLVAFLCFNHYPAKIFMGDCGSLALGGSFATVSMMMLYPLGLFLFALIPLIETLSVIIQVISYKTRGVRVFKMAPLHHHFELSGLHEATVTYRFTLINTLGCLIAMTSYMNAMAVA